MHRHLVISSFHVPVKPVPASRPRISKYGSYYTKTYTDFRREAYLFLKTIKAKYPPCGESTFSIEIEFVCTRPKKLTNPYPRGDVDNYLKGIIDSLVYAGMFFEDDIQITRMTGIKRYQEKDEDVGMNIKVRKYKR